MAKKVQKKFSKKVARKISKNKKIRTKIGGSFLRRMMGTSNTVDKISRDILNLLDAAPRKKADKEQLARFFLRKTKSSNAKHPNLKFKATVYNIAERISKFDFSDQTFLLRQLEKTLKKIVGETYLPSIMDKLRKPSIKENEDTIELEEALADLQLKNSKKKMTTKLNSVNSKLKSTSAMAQRFTEHENNGWEQIDQDEVSNLLKQAQLDSLPNTPTKTPRAKGGYRKIRKSRKYRKRVYV